MAQAHSDTRSSNEGTPPSIEEEVVRLLKAEKIKLWEAPYNMEARSDVAERALLQLCHKLCKALVPEYEASEVESTVRLLRERSVRKLSLKRVVTISARAASKGGASAMGAFDCGTPGHEARRAMALALGVSTERLRLIARGKSLRDDLTLESQGWGRDSERRGAPLRALAITSCEQSSTTTISEEDRLASAVRRVVTDFDLSSIDGSRLSVAFETKTNLVTGLALAAKGRELLDTECAERALGFLAKAEESFACCPTDLIRRVDNVGLVQLDMCRAYALLGDAGALEDAEVRLAQAQAALCRKLDARFVAVALEAARAGRKVPPQLIPVARHRLLRAIALTARRADASADFRDARDLLQALTVDPGHLNTLLLLGASRSEAVAALRRAEGDVQAAAAAVLDQHKPNAERAQAEIVNARALDRLRAISPQTPMEDLATALIRNDNDVQAAFDELTQAPSTTIGHSTTRPPQQSASSSSDIPRDRRARTERDEEYRTARDLVNRELRGSLNSAPPDHVLDGCDLDLEYILLARWAP